MLAEPVGNATPNTAERSTLPGIGLICHFSAGATSEKPEPSGPRTFAKYVGTSTRSSRQFAMPARNRVFVPSTNRPPSRALKLTPFSICRPARRHNKTGIGDVRPIGDDLVLGGR